MLILLSSNISFATFDEEQLLTPDRLSAARKRAGADIVIVEYNGMWKIDSFYNALPESWVVYQEIFIGADTKNSRTDFPGGPVVRTLPSQCGGLKFSWASQMVLVVNNPPANAGT